MNETPLTIEGAVQHPVKFTREQLAALPSAGRVSDVSSIEPRRQGEAIRLSFLLEKVQSDDTATHVTLQSADGFCASIPLADVRETGLIIFQLDDQCLPVSAGGPFRFLIPNAAECRTAELDACANVKSLARIELTVGQGVDTRYSDKLA
jgi:DMSO/TMAO reductase YedYZ molybdopterin-dependent catalytic subunit